jgi:hypothetical protein
MFQRSLELFNLASQFPMINLCINSLEDDDVSGQLSRTDPCPFPLVFLYLPCLSFTYHHAFFE